MPRVQYEIVGDYLQKNEDFSRFVNLVSDNTGVRNMDMWVENLRENRQLFRKSEWAATNLQGSGKNKTVVAIGASPALEKQIPTLKWLQSDKDFILCGLSSNLEYLLNNGIEPKIVLTVDADKTQGVFFDNIDMDKTKDIILIANIFAYPPMLKKWKGPVYFLALQTSDKEFSRKQVKWYGNLNGIGEAFPSLIASYNIMAALAHLMLESVVVIFVGNELSFNDDGSRYYVDRDDPRDQDTRFPHGDIHGNKVFTTQSLLAVKYTLEGFLELLAGSSWFLNCTEAGIFGVTKRFKDYRIPWIEQLTLINGIAQARQIMRTGQPFYE